MPRKIHILPRHIHWTGGAPSLILMSLFIDHLDRLLSSHSEIKVECSCFRAPAAPTTQVINRGVCCEQCVCVCVCTCLGTWVSGATGGRVMSHRRLSAQTDSGGADHLRRIKEEVIVAAVKQETT